MNNENTAVDNKTDAAIAEFKAKPFKYRVLYLDKLLNDPVYYLSSDTARAALVAISLLFDDIKWVYDHYVFRESFSTLLVLATPIVDSQIDNSFILKIISAI